MEKKEKLNKLAELYCDINNLFINVNPSVIEKLKGNTVENILVNKQTVLKAKVAELINIISEKKVELSHLQYPFIISPEHIIKEVSKG